MFIKTIVLKLVVKFGLFNINLRFSPSAVVAVTYIYPDHFHCPPNRAAGMVSFSKPICVFFCSQCFYLFPFETDIKMVPSYRYLICTYLGPLQYTYLILECNLFFNFNILTVLPLKLMYIHKTMNYTYNIFCVNKSRLTCSNLNLKFS